MNDVHGYKRVLLNCAHIREYICVCLVCVSRFIYCNNTACILILRYNVMSLCWENDPGKRPSFDRTHSMLVDQQSTVFKQYTRIFISVQFAKVTDKR